MTPVSTWYHPPWHSQLSFVLDILRGWYYFVNGGLFQCFIIYYFIVSNWFVVFVCIFFFLLFLYLKFSKDPLEKTLLSMLSYCCFSPINTLRAFRVEATWRLRENVVSVLFRRRMFEETLLEVSSPLMSFEDCDSFFME